jgi:hypothetical protein
MTTPADALAALAQALASTETALSAADPTSAQTAVEAGLAAARVLDASAHRPTAAQLEALEATHARLLARATQLRDELAQALEQTSRSRRAASAYGHR